MDRLPSYFSLSFRCRCLGVKGLAGKASGRIMESPFRSLALGGNPGGTSTHQPSPGSKATCTTGPLGPRHLHPGPFPRTPARLPGLTGSSAVELGNPGRTAPGDTYPSTGRLSLRFPDQESAFLSKARRSAALRRCSTLIPLRLGGRTAIQDFGTSKDQARPPSRNGFRLRRWSCRDSTGWQVKTLAIGQASSY